MINVYLFMRKFLCSMVMAFCAVMLQAQTLVPAFPGAEGHGRYVTGGRGGKVVHVSNLNDSGEGSLRQAVKGNDKKIVVFDVGGVIALNSELSIGDNTTIAGQTAPNPGITLRYYTVRPGSNNIIRFIRVRRGQERNANDGADAIWQRELNNIILDHCSFSWSIDEVASFYDNNNFTMQWCTVGESLLNAGHGKGAHGYGGIWGGKLASFHHNFLVHIGNRVPRFNGARYGEDVYMENELYDVYQWENTVQAENVDFRNCVMYNWDNSNGCYGGPGGGQINMVNNYYKGGPATPDNKARRVTTVSVANEKNSEGQEPFFGMTSRYYIKGNTTETHKGEKIQNRDWDGVQYDDGVISVSGEKYSLDRGFYAADVPSIEQDGRRYIRIRMDEPAPTGTVTTHTAEDAFTQVLAYAGASLCRDNVDSRYADEARKGIATYKGSVSGKQGLIDLVSDCEGYTEKNFGTGSRPAGFDTDGDGMPDEWEIKMGLNPNNAADANLYTLDTEKSWYSNLEVYLSMLVENIMKAGNANAGERVDEYYPCSSPTAIGGVELGDDSKVLFTTYYNMQGQRLSSPTTNGPVIEVNSLDNGRLIVRKRMQ